MAKKIVVSQIGVAGRNDSAIKSDLFVSVERREEGGLSLTIESKVEAYYGKSLERLAKRVLRTFAVEDASVEIDDRGALPFVVQARLEAAIRAASYEGRSGVRHTARRQRVKRDCLRRSRLYLPGNEPKFMINAGLHKPDGVILDLEDSVHADQKDAARLVVRNALAAVDFMGAERMVRINQLPLGLLDLDEIIREEPDLILLPKIEHADEVIRVNTHILALQEKEGRKYPIWLMPILESALGIENAFEVATAVDTVVALTIGLEDFTADLGVPKTLEGDESLYARMRIVNAARAAGIQAIDSVFGDVGDLHGLTEWAKRSRGLGFEGMGCIHPRQIAPIHNAFAPTDNEIEKALNIVRAFEEACKKGLAVVSLGSRMIDLPVVLRAERLVANARRAGLLADDQ